MSPFSWLHLPCGWFFFLWIKIIGCASGGGGGDGGGGDGGGGG